MNVIICHRPRLRVNHAVSESFQGYNSNKFQGHRQYKGHLGKFSFIHKKQKFRGKQHRFNEKATLNYEL